MIVKNVDFSVINQTIKFSTMAQLVANSAGIATASFSFSTDWSDYDTIKVIFANGETKKAVILADGVTTVTIPAECMTAGRIAVSAVGLTGAEGEGTFKRATTASNTGVEVVPSGAYEGSPADLPTPTEAEEILLIATNANATAAQANTTANTANANASAAVLTANTANTNAQTALNHTNTFKGLRLARQIVLTGAAATIEFNTDSDGNALNSVLGGELIVYMQSNASISSAVSCYSQLNNVNSQAYWNVLSNPDSNLLLGTASTEYSYLKCSMAIIANNLVVSTNNAYRSLTGGGGLLRGGGMTTPQTAVTAIKLFLSAGTFPAGTVAEWWERG